MDRYMGHLNGSWLTELSLSMSKRPAVSAALHKRLVLFYSYKPLKIDVGVQFKS